MGNNAKKQLFWFIIHNFDLYILIIYTNLEIHHFKYSHNKQLKTVFCLFRYRATFFMKVGQHYYPTLLLCPPGICLKGWNIGPSSARFDMEIRLDEDPWFRKSVLLISVMSSGSLTETFYQMLGPCCEINCGRATPHLLPCEFSQFLIEWSS